MRRKTDFYSQEEKSLETVNKIMEKHMDLFREDKVRQEVIAQKQALSILPLSSALWWPHWGASNAVQLRKNDLWGCCISRGTAQASLCCAVTLLTQSSKPIWRQVLNVRAISFLISSGKWGGTAPRWFPQEKCKNEVLSAANFTRKSRKNPLRGYLGNALRRRAGDGSAASLKWIKFI